MSTVATIISLISQKEITEQKFLSDLGFNRTLLSDWKSGKSKSFTKYLPEISAYFNVSTDYLLGNSDIKNKPTTVSDDGLNADGLRIAKKITRLSDADKARVEDYIALLELKGSQ